MQPLVKVNTTFLWALAQRIGPAIISLAFFLILARLVEPAQFGLLALAQVWLGGFRIVGNAGLSGAIIQARNLTDRQLSTMFFLNLGISMLLVLISSVLVWSIPMDQGMSDLPQVVSLMSVTLMISGFALTQEALAYRGMRFPYLAKRDFIAAIIGGGAGIILALYGWGVWALVTQALTTSLVSVIVLWWGAQWRPKWREFSLTEISSLLNFSLWLMAFQLFAYLVKEIDKTLVGVLVGISALGVYALASKLILVPTVIFSDALNSYLFPKLSALQDSAEDMRRMYLGSVSLTMCLTLPVIFAMGVVIFRYGVDIFGAKWEGVDRVAPYVAIIAACQAYVSPAGSALKALGYASFLFKWAVFVFCLMLIGALGGAGYGIEGILTGLVGANIVCSLAIDLVMWRMMGMKLMVTLTLPFYLIVGSGVGLAAVTIQTLQSLDIQNVLVGLALVFAASLFYFMVIVLYFRDKIGPFLRVT